MADLWHLKTITPLYWQLTPVIKVDDLRQISANVDIIWNTNFSLMFETCKLWVYSVVWYSASLIQKNDLGLVMLVIKHEALRI